MPNQGKTIYSLPQINTFRQNDNNPQFCVGNFITKEAIVLFNWKNW